MSLQAFKKYTIRALTRINQRLDMIDRKLGDNGNCPQDHDDDEGLDSEVSLPVFPISSTAEMQAFDDSLRSNATLMKKLVRRKYI